MKKRRELDALVGGVKPRRKTSNFSKSNTGSSHELLRYNGSDSSDEDYRLHPTKVRNTGLCSTCTSVLIFILLVACLLVCAGLTWMHVEMKKDLEILRKDLQAVEIRSSKSSEDVDKLSPDLQTINKTLYHVISDISIINNTVTQVSGTIAKLSRSLDAAPELKELPGKLQSVSKVLADLGSDVSGMKDTVESVPPFVKSTSDTLENLKNQIQEIKENADKDTSEGREHGSETPDMENLMQTLSQQMQDVNATLSAQFSVLMKASSKHEERLAQLENTSNILQANLSTISTHASSIVPSSDGGSAIDYNSDEFQQGVTAVVQQVLSSESQTGKVDAVMVNITKVLDSLNELKDKYEDLETHSTTGTGETTPGSYVTVEMFNTLGEGVTDQISTLNTSFISLKSDMKTMSQILVRHTNTISNLTHQLTATQSYVANMEHRLQGGSNIPTTVKVEQSSQTLAPNTSSVNTEVTTAPPKQNQESSTSKVTTASPLSVEDTAGTISVGRIKTLNDLEKEFNRWHRFGAVHYADLPQYLGKELPDENILKAYDEDNDGAYSLAEFAKAFGFDMPSTTVKPSETVPPR